MPTHTIGGIALTESQINDVMTRTRDVMPAAAVEYARSLGIPVHRRGEMCDLLEFGNGRFRRRLHEVVSDRAGTIAMRFVIDKSVTKFVLERAGLPVPAGTLVETIDQAIAAARTIGYPVVLKPVDGSHSRATYNDIQDDRDLALHVPEAIETSRTGRALIEQVLHGVQYRATIIDGALVAVHENRIASVVGDGIHTISELIDQENLDPRRAGPPRSRYRPISIDDVSMELLARANLTIDHVLPAGREFRLQKFPLLESGSTSVDCTKLVHPANASILEQAARIIDLPVTTIDLITRHISSPMWNDGGAIIELNCESVLSTGYNLFEGPVYDFGAMHIDMYFPDNARSSVHVIAVLESETSLELCHRMAESITQQGSVVGLSTQQGMCIDGMSFKRVSAANLSSRHVLFNNPAVEVAILEMTIDDLASWSLEWQRIDQIVVPVSALQRGGSNVQLEPSTRNLIAELGDHYIRAPESSPTNEFARQFGYTMLDFTHPAS